MSVADESSFGPLLILACATFPPSPSAEALAGNARTLYFSANELGKDINLLLMFEPPQNGKLFKDLFPVCWKVLSFVATGLSAATVEYTADTGFLVPQRQSGNLVSASNAQRCQTGQTCTLFSKEDESGNYLSPAEEGDEGVLQCVNKADHSAKLGVGFFNKAVTKIEPTFLWKDIDTVAVVLTPKLKIYAVNDYKATELIRDNIQSPLLFEQNLIDLPSFTEWIVSFDFSINQVIITEA
ncbi:hypothetical protein CVT25_004853 [Psilocybe cyanescens]|uniref:Uncharacterized protein n=1 Tax=Psilocybe cyanescens TaxID=93625 RepID=A0A409XMH2_PSICY|nr:hypothetical protein CVT25_004853 [Psilocybe cyanescens]